MVLPGRCKSAGFSCLAGFVDNDEFLRNSPYFPLAFCAILLYNNTNYGEGVVCVCEVVAVLSGKGGTGKTSVCAGISTALAESGQKVLCIDCDIGLRNLDISLGLSQTGALSFLDVAQGGYALEQATRHDRFPDLYFLTAPVSCSAEQIDDSGFSKVLQQAAEQFDYVFLDAPAGVDAGFRLAARFANRVVLVTGSDPASIRDAERTGVLLELMGKENVRLVVNRIQKKMFSAMDITVDDIMDQTGLPLLGVVPEDAHVVFAAAAGKPLLVYTKKGAAAACRRIAKRLQGRSVPITI